MTLHVDEKNNKLLTRRYLSIDITYRHRNIRSASPKEAPSGFPNHHSTISHNDVAVTVTEQPKMANGGADGGQHIVAPLNAHKPLSYSESDNDSDEFGAAEFAAAEALASKGRFKKVRPPPATFNDYPGPIHVP